MTQLQRGLAQIVSDLTSRNVRFALVGGLAVSALADPRTTRDIDLCVSVAHDEEAEALLFALSQMGYLVQATVEQVGTRRLATARLVHASWPKLFINLLFASSGIEPEIAAEAIALEILAGMCIPVARVGHMIAMKLLARDDRARPQDWDDLRGLFAIADDNERAVARNALALIMARGAGRGRELLALFATASEQFG